MGSRARLAVVAASALAVAAVLLWPADDQPPAIAFGFNNNAVTQGLVTPDEAAEQIAAAGGEVDRVQIDWASLEPRPGERDFAPYDAIYAADLRHDVRPLFILAFAPAWATDAACARAPQPCHAAPSPEHYADAAQTAAALAERFPRLAGIEIWNEPNAPHFWAPAPDPQAYAELLAACYAAIKAVDPQMPVAGGSTSSSPGFVPGHIRAPEFVAALQQQGAFDHMDALSLHTYPEQSDSSAKSALAALDSVREAIDGESPPIWITETGVSTSGPDAVSDQEQALTLRRLSEVLPDAEGVEMVLVHTLFDPSPAPATVEAGFGILRPGGEAKPARCILETAWAGESAC